MNAATVAQELADRLATIPGLAGKTSPYAPDTIVAPAAYVFGPETTYTQSYQNGLTAAKLSVTVAVARTPLDVAWKALAGYISDTGTSSVKACLEADEYTAFDTILVTRSIVGDVTIAGTTYKGAQFDINITGTGE